MENRNKNNKEIIHFSHIPKCGGSSFRTGLKEAYKERLCLYYTNPLRYTYYDKLLYKFHSTINLFKPKYFVNDYDIVYGHFCFNGIYTSKERPVKRGVFFRDPIEWIGSLYFYTLKKYKKNFIGKGNIIEFIIHNELQKGYQKHLGSFTIDDVHYIGITEYFEESLILFKKLFGVNIRSHYENKTNFIEENYKSYFIKENLYVEIENLMTDNQTIYDKALNRFNELKDKYL